MKMMEINKIFGLVVIIISCCNIYFSRKLSKNDNPSSYSKHLSNRNVITSLFLFIAGIILLLGKVKLLK